jgi:hypothetical protein
MTMTEINDATGFANGEKFDSAEEVREYFTVAAMREMFNGDQSELPTQCELDEMAEHVIVNGWHMNAR